MFAQMWQERNKGRVTQLVLLDVLITPYDKNPFADGVAKGARKLFFTML